MCTSMSMILAAAGPACLEQGIVSWSVCLLVGGSHVAVPKTLRLRIHEVKTHRR